MQKPIVAAVVAIGKNRELGLGNKLLWHIPEDLQRFKRLTLGHPIIMGRKTFESIVGYIGKPLSNRVNIVVTKDPEAYLNADSTVRKFFNDPIWNKQIYVVGSLDEALERAKSFETDEIHIGGGAEIYKQALPYINKLYLTIIDAEAEADAFFPPYETEFTKKVFEEKHESNGLKYRWVDLERE